ncbi:hypothetical protein DSO57_1037820 [Entomophthora muscae]|nr:hypothetical protein DSO57_1037820 [Entomophthora muscae]
MEDDAIVSDASSLTDIVSKWSTDKSTDSIQELKEKPSDSPLSSLTSEENRVLESKPNRPPNRVKRLNLQQKLDLSQPNVRDRAGRTQLFRYAERSDLEKCRQLLDANADVNISDNAGWRPLHLACGQGATAIVKLFIERGADLHARGLNHQTALHDAALSGNLEIIQHLVQLGADINARNLEGSSPIDLCAQPECLAFMTEQLEMKREINSQNRDGHSRLHLACIEENIHKVTQLLLDGADVNVTDIHGASPIHIAAQNGSLEIIAALVKRGALVDQQDGSGNTSLHLATQNNQLKAVKLLLENRSNPLVRNQYGQLPLDLCKSDIIAGLLRDHIIAFSTRAMDMDVLLPRASKTPLIDNLKSRAKYSGVITPSERLKSKFKLNTFQIPEDYLPGLQALKNQPASSPSQLADPHTPNSGSLGAFPEDQLLTREEKLGLREALGYLPLYCVKLPTALELGYMVLDFQVQHFLRLPLNSLLMHYPRLTHRQLTRDQKERMWPVMHQMLKANNLTGKQLDRNEFLNFPINFVRLLEIVAIVLKNYRQLSPFLEHVALDINYESSLAEAGPDMAGDEGFPPEEILIRSSTSTSSETNLPTPPVRRPPHSDIDFLGPPASILNLTSFLQRNPRLNPRPDLPLKEAARFFISRFHPYRP